jgi:hypothetical protein
MATGGMTTRHDDGDGRHDDGKGQQALAARHDKDASTTTMMG